MRARRFTVISLQVIVSHRLLAFSNRDCKSLASRICAEHTRERVDASGLWITGERGPANWAMDLEIQADLLREARGHCPDWAWERGGHTLRRMTIFFFLPLLAAAQSRLSGLRANQPSPVVRRLPPFSTVFAGGGPAENHFAPKVCASGCFPVAQKPRKTVRRSARWLAVRVDQRGSTKRTPARAQPAAQRDRRRRRRASRRRRSCCRRRGTRWRSCRPPPSACACSVWPRAAQALAHVLGNAVLDLERTAPSVQMRGASTASCRPCRGRSG